MCHKVMKFTSDCNFVPLQLIQGFGQIFLLQGAEERQIVRPVASSRKQLVQLVRLQIGTGSDRSSSVCRLFFGSLPHTSLDVWSVATC